MGSVSFCKCNVHVLGHASKILLKSEARDRKHKKTVTQKTLMERVITSSAVAKVAVRYSSWRR